MPAPIERHGCNSCALSSTYTLFDAGCRGRTGSRKTETQARGLIDATDYHSCMKPSRVYLSKLAAALALCAMSGVGADVYKYVDETGKIHLTDRPPHAQYRLVLKSRKGWRQPEVDYRAMETNRQRFSSSITDIARRHDMPEGLLHAVVATESAYDPEAVSSAGAVGLMQLMPDTAKRYGVENRRDPTNNLSAGTRYLKDLLLRFDNNIELALAGYNAGEKAVEKYGNQVPPYEETQTYVRRVLALYRQYLTGEAGRI